MYRRLPDHALLLLGLLLFTAPACAQSRDFVRVSDDGSVIGSRPGRFLGVTGLRLMASIEGPNSEPLRGVGHRRAADPLPRAGRLMDAGVTTTPRGASAQ